MGSQPSLQRGRAHVSAEMSLAGWAAGVVAGLASTGPRSRERGNCRSFGEYACPHERLQRGRAHVSAEMNQFVIRDAHVAVLASTGPRSRERGNHPGDPEGPASEVMLQRGRAHVSAEIFFNWRRPS